MKVVVLGATGMLGSTMIQVLGDDPNIKLQITTRGQLSTKVSFGEEQRLETVDACSASVADLTRLLEENQWAVNCIGLIKPHIYDGNPETSEAALRINALFPHLLAIAARQTGCRVLQIATDCVYAGLKGGYAETDPHDGWDVYGKTKSLGEVSGPNMHHIRCSIIGRERKVKRSLLEWFLGQPEGASVDGYTNHLWNGITALHFARVCQGVIRANQALPQLCHIVPADSSTKYDLLCLMRSIFRRTDISIRPTEASTPVDRTLRTNLPRVNRRLWTTAGYEHPPRISTMLEELDAWSSGLPRGEI